MIVRSRRLVRGISRPLKRIVRRHDTPNSATCGGDSLDARLHPHLLGFGGTEWVGRSGPGIVRPSAPGTIAVAIALFAAALLIASAGRLLVDPLPPPTVRVLTFCLGAVFLARAVGDFRLVGFFKRVQGTKFAHLDTLVYAPLCLFLGIAAVFVAYHDV
jgi:hypothetical protein